MLPPAACAALPELIPTIAGNAGDIVGNCGIAMGATACGCCAKVGSCGIAIGATAAAAARGCCAKVGSCGIAICATAAAATCGWGENRGSCGIAICAIGMDWLPATASLDKVARSAAKTRAMLL